MMFNNLQNEGSPGTAAGRQRHAVRRNRDVLGRSTAIQSAAALVAFAGLFVSCVTSPEAAEDRRPTLTEDDAVYGEITAGLDAPLWDEGDGRPSSVPDNPIDRALSQSPYEGERSAGVAWSGSEMSQGSGDKALDVKQASKHKKPKAKQAKSKKKRK